MTTTICHRSNPACPAPAAYRIDMVCVHEHIITSAACVNCARQANQLGVTCHLCANGPEPHKCEARLLRERT